MHLRHHPFHPQNQHEATIDFVNLLMIMLGVLLTLLFYSSKLN